MISAVKAQNAFFKMSVYLKAFIVCFCLHIQNHNVALSSTWLGARFLKELRIVYNFLKYFDSISIKGKFFSEGGFLAMLSAMSQMNVWETTSNVSHHYFPDCGVYAWPASLYWGCLTYAPEIMDKLRMALKHPQSYLMVDIHWRTFYLLYLS